MCSTRERKTEVENEGKALRKWSMAFPPLKPTEQSSKTLESKAQSHSFTTTAASARSSTASPLPFLLVQLVLSPRSTCSLDCHLRQTRSLGHRRTLLLLGQMRRVSPFSCLRDRHDWDPSAGVGWTPGPEGTSHLHAPWDDPAALHPQQHTGGFCCLGQGPPGHSLHCTLSSCVPWKPAGHRQWGWRGHLWCLGTPCWLWADTSMQSCYAWQRGNSPCAWEVVREAAWRAMSLSSTLQERLQSRGWDWVQHENDSCWLTHVSHMGKFWRFKDSHCCHNDDMNSVTS